ncbi:MAG TPA: glycosyltransferase family 39 protein [Candidatus Krumholzibacteria bacterium]|nr:glycosyltransferase family 39 protein [Candidatus Krumholzibacteria bacterium]
MSEAGAGRRRAAWVAILAVAALARLVFAGAVVGWDTPPKADEADYHAIAVNLLEGDGFVSFEGTPTARRPPGYPVFLAAVYAIAGESPRAGRVVQVILGVVVVALTGLLARRYFGESIALLAAGLSAINPFLIFISGYLLTENLYMVLLLAALVTARDPRTLAASHARAAATGVILALATLARPTGLPMLEWVLAALLALSGVAWRARLVRGALAAAAFALVVLPWYARNASVVGGWVLTTHGGITFLQGNNEKVASVPQWRGGAAPLEVLPRFDEMAGLDEFTRDRLAFELGYHYVQTHANDVPELVFWKMVRFWRLHSDMGLSGVKSGWWWSKNSTLGRLAADIDVGFAYAIVAVPLFVLGVVVTFRRWRELSLLLGVVAVHTAVAMVFYGSLRSRIPVEPVMCVLAAVALAAIVGRVRARGGRVATAPG